MKNYAIYQFFIDTNYKERNLLVGFAEAESEQYAKKAYLLETYPNDGDKQDFAKGYLTAHECKKEDFLKTDLLDAIKKNKAELGVFA